MPIFALNILCAVRRMNHLFRINAVICWWILHSCVITQVSLQLFLARNPFYFGCGFCSYHSPLFLTWCSSALWTARIQHTRVACGIYGILAAQWVRKELALFRWSCFSSPSCQKRPRQFAGQSSVWAAAPATKSSTVLSQGWEFCIIWTQLQSHTTYWGKCRDNHNMRHEPHSFLCFSFASFLFWKKAFHNCSLYWGACIKLMRVFNNCYEQTAFILKHLYTLITLSFLRCSCCIKCQKKCFSACSTLRKWLLVHYKPVDKVLARTIYYSCIINSWK